MEGSVWKPLNLHGRNGLRKYLNINEREAFLRNASLLPPDRKAFCFVLAYTGCRISEALSLRRSGLDANEGILVLETLKQRRRDVYRAIPIPTELMELLASLPSEHQLFAFSRTTAWRFIKAVMAESGITGECNSMPKAIRHSFGIAHAKAKTPPNLMQRWYGHSRIETTHIYLDAVGEEEREFASGIWTAFSESRKNNSS